MKPLFSTLIAAASLFIASLPIMGCGGKDTPGHIPDYKPKPGKEDYKYVKAEGNVRIMTYNCFYCKSNTASKTFSAEHTAAFAQVIKALNPDVVVIQELDSGTTERAKRYLLDDIRRATGLDYDLFFASAAPYSEGKRGRAIQTHHAAHIHQEDWAAWQRDPCASGAHLPAICPARHTSRLRRHGPKNQCRNR